MNPLYNSVSSRAQVILPDVMAIPPVLSRVCHSLSDNELCRVLNVSKAMFCHVDQYRVIKINENRFQYLKHLHLANISSLLPFLSRNGQLLFALNLMGVHISEDVLQVVINHCHQLTRLKIESCSLTDQEVIGIVNGLKHLDVLDLRGCKCISDSSVKAIARGLKRLKLLDLNSCKKITDASVKTIARRQKSLKDLSLSFCKEITDDSVKTIARKIIHLEGLHLVLCNRITDLSANAIAGGLKQLQRLRIGCCDLITDEGVKSIAKELKHLKELDISDCALITDAAMIMIASLTQLKELRLDRCRNITDRGMIAIANELTQLTKLTFNGCKNITNIGIFAIAEGLKLLQELDLGCCNHNQITDEGARAIAASLKHLTVLQLQQAHITDLGIRVIASGLQHLEAIDFSGCIHITLEGVKWIIAMENQLEWVFLVQCTQFKRAVLKTLKQANPSIHLLYGE